jgi:hypothetical protein
MERGVSRDAAYIQYDMTHRISVILAIKSGRVGVA